MIKSIIFAAPSGSGKTTIVKHILSKYPNIEFSISVTTREPRYNEKNGVDYHFLSIDSFKQMIDLGYFLEYQEVYKDQFYGTLKSDVIEKWNNGKIVMFDIDVVGGVNLKKILGDESLSIFVKAPSIKELENRLINRKTEDIDKIKIRVDKAIEEMAFENDYDFVVINENIDNAIKQSETKIESIMS